MAPDKLQQVWQSQSTRTRVTIDAELLRKEVERSDKQFRAMIFWRDFHEVFVGIVMLPLWLYLGNRFALPWTWYLAVPAILWVVGFILVDRLIHKRTAAEPGVPLVTAANDALSRIEHQIWLLRNVFWWYLAPFMLPMLAFFAQVAWQNSQNWLEGIAAFGLPATFVAVLYYLIYRLNKRAVQTQLVPRRRELRALLAGLGGESTEDVATTDTAADRPDAAR